MRVCTDSRQRPSSRETVSYVAFYTLGGKQGLPAAQPPDAQSSEGGAYIKALVASRDRSLEGRRRVYPRQEYQ